MNLSKFSVPAFRIDALSKRIAKLTKKAAKYGNDDISISFGSPYVTKIKRSDGTTFLLEMVDVSVAGTAPQIAGWTLAARVELISDETLVHVVPGSGIDIEQRFRTHKGQCEHCNKIRRRNDVYVLSDGTKQMAVGRTCLRDFLGIDNPELIVARAQFFEELNDSCNEDIDGSFGSAGILYLSDVMNAAAAFVRLNGFRSKAKATEGTVPTVECVWFSLSGIPGYEVEVTEEDRATARATIDFFRNAEQSFGNEYMDNIRVLMKTDVVKGEHLGLVVSAIAAVQRAESQKRQQKLDATKSRFVGQLKQRIKGVDVQLDKVIFLGHGAYGASYLHLMKDQAGNVFSWVSSNKIDAKEGSTFKIDASIKDHKVYNGVEQTVLTRAKIV